jgi:hypothetical protein
MRTRKWFPDEAVLWRDLFDAVIDIELRCNTIDSSLLGVLPIGRDFPGFRDYVLACSADLISRRDSHAGFLALYLVHFLFVSFPTLAISVDNATWITKLAIEVCGSAPNAELRATSLTVFHRSLVVLTSRSLADIGNFAYAVASPSNWESILELIPNLLTGCLDPLSFLVDLWYRRDDLISRNLTEFFLNSLAIALSPPFCFPHRSLIHDIRDFLSNHGPFPALPAAAVVISLLPLDRTIVACLPDAISALTDGVSEIPLSVWMSVIGTHVDFVGTEAFPYLGGFLTFAHNHSATATYEILFASASIFPDPDQLLDFGENGSLPDDAVFALEPFVRRLPLGSTLENLLGVIRRRCLEPAMGRLLEIAIRRTDLPIEMRMAAASAAEAALSSVRRWLDTDMIEGLKICARIVILGAKLPNTEPLPVLQTYVEWLYRHYEGDRVNIGLAMTDLLADLFANEISVDSLTDAFRMVEHLFLNSTAKAKMYGSLALIAKAEPAFVYRLVQSDVEGEMSPTKALCIFAVFAFSEVTGRLRLSEVELNYMQRLDLKVVPDAISILVVWMRKYSGSMAEIEFRVLGMCLKLCATLVRPHIEGSIGRMHIPVDILSQLIDFAKERFSTRDGWLARLRSEWNDEPERLEGVLVWLNS